MLEFDWLEEGGCIECEADPRPEEDGGKFYLVWHCDDCGGGRAEYVPVD